MTSAVGANYIHFDFIGSELEAIIKYHLQFTDDIERAARKEIDRVSVTTGNLKDMVYIGVHVR